MFTKMRIIFSINLVFRELTGLEKCQFSLEEPCFRALHPTLWSINTKYNMIVAETYGNVTGWFVLAQSYLTPSNSSFQVTSLAVVVLYTLFVAESSPNLHER